jgi:RNA recognition motif-containing protein
MRGRKLYVGNLNHLVTTEELRALFSHYGQVRQVKMVQGGRFGFVEMSSKPKALRAREALDRFNLNGRVLRVDEARPNGWNL